MIEGIECRALAGEDVDVGSWTQLTNTWLGIARALGLERRQRPVESLHTLMYRDDPAPAAAESGDQSEGDAMPAVEENSAQVAVDEAAG